MCESQTASNYTSDTDLPKFKLAGLRRVLELLEFLAVTAPQKIAAPHRLSRPPHRKRSEPGRASKSEGVHHRLVRPSSLFSTAPYSFLIPHAQKTLTETFIND